MQVSVEGDGLREMGSGILRVAAILVAGGRLIV